MTGKAMIPIVEDGDGYELTLSGISQRVGRDQVAEVESQVQRKGYYPVRMTSAQVAELEKDPAKVQTLFTEQMCKTVERWMQLASEKLKDSKVRVFVAPGNDDEMEIDEVIANAPRVELAEGKMIDIGGYEMISSGWANPTPWHTYREAPEEELAKRMEPMLRDIKNMGRAIFNFHPPPYGTSLDEAPALDENLKPLHGDGPCGTSARRRCARRSTNTSRCSPCTATSTKARASPAWARRSPSIPAAPTRKACCSRRSSNLTRRRGSRTTSWSTARR